MKKFVIGILVVCLVLAVAVGVNAAQRSAQAMDAETETEPVTETAEAAEPDAFTAAEDEQPDEPSTVPDEPAVASGRLDFDALYALYDPEEKVLSVSGSEESWGDFFYFLYVQCGQIEEYFNAMAAYYGMIFRWDEPMEEDADETYADSAVETAEMQIIMLTTLERFAEENGIVLDDEALAKIETVKQEDILNILGEDGTEEEFFAFLEQNYLPEKLYHRMRTSDLLYQESFVQLYGENSEKLPAEQAVAWLEENGYRSVAHILLETEDETGAALSEEETAEKRAELEALLEELRAIEDPEVRAEAFLEKMNELSEDPGKAYYPRGYTYTPGTMVSEFEEAAENLPDYEISDIVETDYGYHILLRLPLAADAVVEISNTTGEPRTARMLAANREYSKRLQELADSLELEWLPGYEAPDLLDFVAE